MLWNKPCRQQQPENAGWKRTASAAISALLMTLSTAAKSAESDVLPLPSLAEPAPFARGENVLCGRRLMTMAGKSVDEQAFLLSQIRGSSINRSADFLSYLYAIAYVESRFSTDAMSSAQARGILQLTRIGAEDAAIECGLPLVTEDALDTLLKVSINVHYSSCLLRKYLRETKGSWFHALVLYNGGYVQLARYLASGTLTDETQRYVLSVLHARGICLAK